MALPEAPARRWKAGTLSPSGGMDAVRAGGGRTGAVDGRHRMARHARAPSGFSAGLDQVTVGGPHPHDPEHRDATGRTAGRAQKRRGVRWRRPLARGVLPHQPADGRQRDGTAGMEQAEVADFHQALGQDMRKESPDQLEDAQVQGAEAGPAHFLVGEGNGPLPEAYDAALGDGDLEDLGGQVGEGGMAVMMGLTRHVPGAAPDLGIDGLQEASLAHLFFEEGAVDGGEGVHGDQEMGAGGAPARAILGEATAWNDRVDVGMRRELPAPGREDAGAPWQVRSDEALVFGQPLEGRGGGMEQGRVGGAWGGAAEGTPGLRDREGHQEVRPGQLVVEVILEPRLGLVLLTLGTVAVAPGMVHTGLPPTCWARLEAVAVVAALAVWDGADHLMGWGGKVRIALQRLGSKGGAEVAPGGHGKSPCMRGFRRSSASSWPLGVRWREIRVVSSGACPR
jgi:hypothetical protein